MKRFITLALLPIALSSCQSPYVRFDAVGPDKRMGRQARYVIQNEKEGYLASVSIGASGHRRLKLEDHVTDTVNVTFDLDNPSRDPLNLPMNDFRATDDQGQQYTIIAPPAPPAEGAAPGSRFPVRLQLRFDTGNPDRLRITDAITLEWSYSYRNRTVTHKTRFLPVRYVRQYQPATGYYYPSWYVDFRYSGHW